jgi:hypothetical protein
MIHRWLWLRDTAIIAPVSAGLGILMAVIGVARGLVPLRLTSILLAFIISGGAWGLVAWAVATAAADSEHEPHELD